MTEAERLEPIRLVRRDLFEKGPVQLRKEGDFEIVALPSGDSDVLRDILVGEHARTVIEIGLAYASSALAIAEALVLNEGAVRAHTIIDGYQETFHDSGWNALVAAGLGDVVTFDRERSQLVLPRLVAEGVLVDAAFVDGSHIFHNVFLDLAYLRYLIRPGGIAVLDDCDYSSVATAVRYFEVNTG